MENLCYFLENNFSDLCELFLYISIVGFITCPLEVTGAKYSVFRIQWFFMPALLFRLCV